MHCTRTVSTVHSRHRSRRSLGKSTGSQAIASASDAETRANGQRRHHGDSPLPFETAPLRTHPRKTRSRPPSHHYDPKIRKPRRAWGLRLRLLALLLLDLEQQGAIDVGQDAAEGDGGADEGVELLVAADGELQVARGDALDLEVLGGVAGQLEHLGRQVLQHGCQVDGRLRPDPRLLPRDRPQVPLYAPARELRCRVSAAPSFLPLWVLRARATLADASIRTRCGGPAVVRIEADAVARARRDKEGC